MNYQDKYKDRTPEETIQIIKTFFNEKGFTIKVQEEKQSEIGTWWISLDLYYKNYFIVHANGKGMTQLFSQASGYAELYERFCNNSNALYITMASQKIKEERFKKYGYYLANDEKEISFKEATETSMRIKYKMDLLNDNENTLEDVYNIAFNNKLIALPYQKIDSSENKYLVPEIVQATTGSDGMAAGNTLEEALVQGISEIYEHIIWDKLYEDINEQIIELNFNTLILPLDLKNKGLALYDLGYDFKIFDYSYTYNMPVIGILLINKINYHCAMILGAHPIFTIALERCFTEIYQGIFTYKKETLYDTPIFPIKNNNDIIKFQYNNLHSLSKRNCYNEKQFYNTKLMNNYNQNIFLINTNYNNKMLLNYYIKLSNNLNLNFFYRDFSLSKNFFAIHVFLDNYIIFSYTNYKFIKGDEDLKHISLSFLKDFLILNNNYNIKTINNLLKNYQNIYCNNKLFPTIIIEYLYYFPHFYSVFTLNKYFLPMFFSLLSEINYNKNNDNIIEMFYYTNNFICEYYYNNNNIQYLTQNILLLSLLSKNQYSNEEIQSIFKHIFNININNINIDKIKLFLNTFFINLNNFKEFQEYIKKMIE